MRIVELLTELGPSGTERLVLTLCEGLSAAGHDVCVVSLKPIPEESFVVQGLRRSGIRIRSLELEKARPWRALGLGRILREVQPDVVHAHLFHPSLLSRLPWRAPGFRVVNTVHVAERRPTKRWYFLLDRLTRSRCDVMTGVSESVARFHANQIGCPERALRVVKNGVPASTPLDRVEVAALRREWDVSDCTRVLGSVGRLHPQKGYDVLLGMLPALGAAIPAGETFGLVLLGEGPERRRLERLARRAPPNVVVRLPGFRPDADRAMGAFDLFLMPSRYEGFGLVLAEAMAMGLPVLASDVDSLPEVLGAYSPGATLPFGAGDETAVVEAILHLSRAAPGTPTAAFSVTEMIAGYLACFGHDA